RCFAYCPKAEVDLDALSRRMWNTPYDARPLGVYSAIVAARSGEAMPRAKFQGGGTVSALMTCAMQRGLVDVAALTGRDGLMPAPRLVTRWQEVAAAAGSQFMASPTLAGVNVAARQGYKRIGVVGTPCQMLAVAQMRANPLEKEEHHVPVALALGLFCNWSLDTRQLDSLLAGRVEADAIRGMDIPPPPANVMMVQTDKGKVEIPLSEIKPLIPHTCFTCLDMTSEFADLSVGMYEGRPGWNTLVVRSDSGARLVADAQAGGLLVTEAMPAEVIAHLSAAAATKKERSLRILLQRGLINTANGQRAAVRMPQEALARILPPRA
ncbi:MAG: Coenzyme F420 hydrogenase/dehydrogenase, beta subunit C-terminal domain, partial [Desulfatitalea sp.]|nr:Coenzyme F420 hydrogenase/dehydrogenase, beta subunit C-terminal domain [Desulfatitalea sp.]